jgi:hypothetical protein
MIVMTTRSSIKVKPRCVECLTASHPFVRDARNIPGILMIPHEAASCLAYGDERQLISAYTPVDPAEKSNRGGFEKRHGHNRKGAPRCDEGAPEGNPGQDVSRLIPLALNPANRRLTRRSQDARICRAYQRVGNRRKMSARSPGVEFNRRPPIRKTVARRRRFTNVRRTTTDQVQLQGPGTAKALPVKGVPESQWASASELGNLGISQAKPVITGMIISGRFQAGLALPLGKLRRV